MDKKINTIQMKKIILILSIALVNLTSFGQIDRSKAPNALANPEIKINIPESMVFDNGLKVIMVENHKLPVVSFQLFVDYPVALEGDKAGLSSIFGEMLGSGTKKNPKDQFDQKIDFMGASFFANSRGFYASSLKKHTHDLLTLLGEVLTQPDFSSVDFDRIIAQNLSNLSAIPSDAPSISSNVSSVVNFGENHPYGEIMTEATLGAITLEDIKAFYQKNFIPNHAYLVVVGDVSKEDVKDYVTTYFGTWQAKQMLPKGDFVVNKAKGNNVYFVNKPGSVQSVISIQHTVALTPGHPDEIKLSVLNQILGGGGFSARLMANLREDKAYTYGCYSNLSSDPLVGIFKAGGSFRNEVTDSAIVQILMEIDKITENVVMDEELDLIKKSMTGAFARSLEDPQTIARFALNTIRYNLPSDYYSNYLKRLEKITKEDLLSVAMQYLTPDNVNIIVVGNEEIAEKLNKFDVDGKIDFKNYYGQAEAKLDPIPQGVTANTIFDTYLMKVMNANSATELANNLKAIQQIEVYSSAFIKELNGNILSYQAMGTPNKSANYVYVKSAMMNGVFNTSWFNGTNGENAEQGIVTAITGDDLAAMLRPSYPVEQVNYVSDPMITVELLGIVKEEKASYYKVKILKKDALNYEYYDTVTGLLMKSESFKKDEAGNESVVIINYSEYTNYDGVLMAKVTEVNSDGQTIKFEVVKVVTGKKVKAKSFTGDFKAVEKVVLSL